MAKVRRSSSSEEILNRPALSDEAKESQLVALAVNQAEQQLREGKASSQVLTHYLKLGTTMAKLDLERARLENELVKAKIESLQSTKRMEELYANALAAMQIYSGRDTVDESDIDD